MPFYLDIKHTGVYSSNSSRFSRNYEIDGAINGTSISSNAPGGVTLSVGNRGDDTVCFNVFVNREGRTYGVTMIRFAYYYGIKGREY